MTRNQIDYAKHLEQARANRVQEALQAEVNSENRRHNLQTEAETTRTNRENEAIRTQTNAINATHYATMDSETNRHNLASEALLQRQQTETERYNREVLAETNRANLARESETQRSNLAKEAETSRANKASESETALAHRNAEMETARANAANEKIRTETNAINARSVAEQARSNAANERLTRAEIQRKSLADVRSYDLGRENLAQRQTEYEWQKFTDMLGQGNTVKDQSRQNALASSQIGVDSSVAQLNSARSREAEAGANLKAKQATETVINSLKNGYGLGKDVVRDLVTVYSLN